MIDNWQQRYKLEEREQWRDLINKIPYLQFDSKWKVKIIPPINGAIIRFHVSYKDKWLSIYLDFYDRLAGVGQPYWEIYPVDNDIQRFLLNDHKEMMDKIKELMEGK